MKEVWAINYRDLTVYPVMAEPDPSTGTDNYWYVDDDHGWYGTYGYDIFPTRQLCIDALLHVLAEAMNHMRDAFARLTVEWGAAYVEEATS